jgi:hypothetical protein
MIRNTARIRVPFWEETNWEGQENDWGFNTQSIRTLVEEVIVISNNY